MKTKHLLTALVLPALFAACTEDAFESSVNNNDANLNGQLVELGKDFAVGLTRGGDDAATRTNWHYTSDAKGLYSWLPRFSADGTSACVESIGFAWRGETGDAKVRTNYKFELSGVLAVGETKPETLICDDELAVKNGYLFKKDATGCEVAVSSSAIQLLGFNKNTKKNDDESFGKISYNSTTGAYTVGSYTLAEALDADELTEGDPYVRNGILITSYISLMTRISQKSTTCLQLLRPSSRRIIIILTRWLTWVARHSVTVTHKSWKVEVWQKASRPKTCLLSST